MSESSDSASSSHRSANGPTPLGLPGVGIRPTWERGAFIFLAILAVVFGGLVLQRSAYSKRLMTDAGVFFRAGWAVRAGVNPYTVCDENDWYFLYPPAIAAAMVPLADPPGYDPLPPHPNRLERTRPFGYLTYAQSIVAWYALSVVCLVLCVRWMCRALQLLSPRPEIRALSRTYGGWWNLRFWPLIAILPDALSTLSRGQVNLIMLACMCLGILLVVRGRHMAAGAAVAMGACIKIIPGLLVVAFIADRRWRSVLGAILCCVIMFAVVPVVVFGLERTIDYTWTFTQHVLLAGLGIVDIPSLQAGSGPENTDNASIQGLLHNVANITTPRGDRPPEIEPWVKLAHVLVALGLTGVTLFVGGAKRIVNLAPSDVSPAACADRLTIVLRLSMLACVMLAAAPMTHRHYFVFMYPAIALLTFLSMQRSRLGLPTGAGLFVCVGVPILLAIPKIHQEGLLRDLPIPQACNLIVWSLCLRELLRLRRGDSVLTAPVPA